MEMKEYHPFKSSDMKEKYLKMYDMQARKWPVPSETKFVDTSYGKTFVRISGPINAPPLVLLPGKGANSLMWIHNIKSLSESYRTYAIDTIDDFGRSVYIRPLKDSKDYVNWLGELLNALKLKDNINIIGLSMGGWLTSQYLLNSPTRLNKVVLLAPASTVLSVRLMFYVRVFMGLIPRYYFFKNMQRWVFEDYAKKNKRGMEELIDTAYISLKCFKLKMPPKFTVLSDKEWENIKVPTLFLVGENEKEYSAEKAIKRLNNVAPQIKTGIIPNAGHDMLLVQTEIVNEKILEFLKNS